MYFSTNKRNTVLNERGDKMYEKKVAAVVLNYNSSEDCRKCISYLKKQIYPNLSIIVVDNASSDVNEQVRLNKLCESQKIELIVNKENLGFSAGNNTGLRSAIKNGADWMLVINPDVELRDPRYISYVMEQLPRWPQAAVIGTNVLLPSKERQNPMREITAFEEIFWPLEFLKQKMGLWDGYHSKNETGYCEKVSGCCFFVSKEFLEKNNYLDENVFMYCEEPILSKCVIKQGYKELYIKESTANHEHYSVQKQGTSSTKMTMFIQSRIYYINKYSDYNWLVKRLSVLSRKIQLIMWRRIEQNKVHSK